MSRPLRISYPGAFYHVTSRGNEKRNIFLSVQDRKRFLDYIESANEKFGAIIHCYCLMSNHYHLLLETPHGNLSSIIHHINSSYTTYFNIKRSRSGHLFQGRFKAILVDREAYLVELSRYIHTNPVRAGLVENPWDYKWSSCTSYTGDEEAPSWLERSHVLGLFGNNPHKGYKSFVIKNNNFDPYKNIHASSILGDEGFVNKVQKFIKGREARGITALKKVFLKPSFEAIEKAANLTAPEGHKRKAALYISQTKGYSLKEIGDHYNMKPEAVSQSNLRFKAAIRKHQPLEKAIDEIRKKLEMSIV
jgi:REP element-mobilizing transposase RayT